MNFFSSAVHVAFIGRAHHRAMLRFLPLLLTLASAAAAAATPADRPLVIDPARSTVEVAVKATMDSFTGRLDAYDARLTVAPDSGHITAAAFSFGFADLKTGKPKRDTAMLEWIGENHRSGSFTLVRLDPLTGDRSQAHGTLTLHGVSQEVTFPVTITTDRHVYALDGEAVIDSRNFDLPVIRLMGVLKVDPLVRVRFHLQGELSP